MKYYINVMYKLNKKNTACIVFDIISLALGLVVGVVFLAQANLGVKDKELDDELLNKNQFAVYEPSYNAGKIQDDERMELEERIREIQNILVENRLNDEILEYNNSFCMDAYILSVSDNFGLYFKPEAIKGRMIEEENEILIGKDVAEQYDIHIGDVVEMDIYTFSVCGIVQTAKYKKAAICLHSGLDGIQYADCIYYVEASEEGMKAFDGELIKSGYADNVNYVKVSEEGAGVFDLKQSGHDYTCYSAQEVLKKEQEYLKTGWGPSILIAVISLFYALLNIMNVEMFFAIKQRKSIAVMQALGASKEKMILAKVLYSLFVSFLSGFLVVLLTRGLQKTEFRYLIDISIDFKLIVVIIVSAQIIYAAFCYILYYRIYRKSIVNILSDG